jgi:hypothetical protein
MLMLPLLVASLPTPSSPITLDTNAALEALVNQQVRAAIADGGTLIELGGETALTVVDGDVATRFIVEIDEMDGEGGTFRIETEAAPAAPSPGDELIAAAMAAPRGGVTIESECGWSYFAPFVVERHAAGEGAGLLVSEALIDADDVEWATIDGDRAEFAIQRGADALTLSVTLGPGGAVKTAELVRVRYHADWGDFSKQQRLERALRKGGVTAIESGDDGLPALRIGEKRFGFEADQFVAHPRDEEEGCGC